MVSLTSVVINVGVIAAGTLLTIVGVATPHWTELTFNGEDTVQGLFKVCSRGLCLKIDSLQHVQVPDSLVACRGANISGAILGGLSVFIASIWIIKTRNEKDKNPLPLLTLGTSVLAAILVVVALVVYLVELYLPVARSMEVGYSIYLNGTGAFLLLVGGIVFKVGTTRYMRSLPWEPSNTSGQVICAPYPSSLSFYNLQQQSQANNQAHQGLVFQQPQATTMQPPPPYTHYSEEQQTFVAHVDRDLREGEYTPGEVRKSAPGISSI